jgi:hypothetical protein
MRIRFQHGDLTQKEVPQAFSILENNSKKLAAFTNESRNYRTERSEKGKTYLRYSKFISLIQKNIHI